MDEQDDVLSKVCTLCSRILARALSAGRCAEAAAPPLVRCRAGLHGDTGECTCRWCRKVTMPAATPRHTCLVAGGMTVVISDVVHHVPDNVQVCSLLLLDELAVTPAWLAGTNMRSPIFLHLPDKQGGCLFRWCSICSKAYPQQ